jgi:hypothetical protein
MEQKVKLGISTHHLAGRRPILSTFEKPDEELPGKRRRWGLDLEEGP